MLTFGRLVYMAFLDPTHCLSDRFVPWPYKASPSFGVMVDLNVFGCQLVIGKLLQEFWINFCICWYVFLVETCCLSNWNGSTYLLNSMYEMGMKGQNIVFSVSLTSQSSFNEKETVSKITVFHYNVFAHLSTSTHFQTKCLWENPCSNNWVWTYKVCGILWKHTVGH